MSSTVARNARKSTSPVADLAAHAARYDARHRAASMRSATPEQMRRYRHARSHGIYYRPPNAPRAVPVDAPFECNPAHIHSLALAAAKRPDWHLTADEVATAHRVLAVVGATVYVSFPNEAPAPLTAELIGAIPPGFQVSVSTSRCCGELTLERWPGGGGLVIGVKV